MKKVTFMLLALLCAFVANAAQPKRAFSPVQMANVQLGQRLNLQQAHQGLVNKAMPAKARGVKKAVIAATDVVGDYTWDYLQANNLNTDLESVSGTSGSAHVKIEASATTEGGLTISGMFTNPLEATIDAEYDAIVIEGGQLAGTSSYGDYVLWGAYYSEGDDENEAGWYYTDIYGLIQEDGSIVFADDTWFCRVLSGGNYDGYSLTPYWMPSSTLTPAEPLTLVELPVGAEVENYVMSYEDYEGNPASTPINVAVVGDEVFFQGLSDYLPQAWVKGTKDGNTVTFAEMQYVGDYSSYASYAFYNGEAVFTYDAEADTYSAEGEIYGVLGDQYYDGHYFNPVLKKVIEQAAMPANPEITNLADGNYGWYFDFNVPLVDTEGNGLVASKLSYMIYTDVEGEITPLTFTPETHTRLTEEMTEIPYGFTENYDFYNGEIYLNDLYSKSWNKIGIQSIYRGGDETNATEIQWYDIKPYATPGIVWVAAEQGYEDGQTIAEIDFGEGVTATLSQGTHASIAPRYWAKDQTLRTYAGNTITITSAEQTINKIEITFPLNAKEVALEADKGDYERTGNVGTWTGEENEVTFTSGKAFISQIAIYLGNGEVKLVELPEGVEPEVWTIDGTYADNYSSENIVRATEAAIVGNTIYVKGIPFYFEEAWMKGTIDAETGVATFKSGQFVGEDSDGQEFMIGSDDGQTICDIEFLYDAEEKTLTQLTSYIVENADTPDEISAYGYWYDMVIYAGEPVIVEPVEAPEGLETSTYLFTAQALENNEEEATFEDYSAQLQVGFDGQDVYFQGIATDVPDLWVKGTLSEDGKTVTIPANQYMGQLYVWGYTFDYFFTAVDQETYGLTDVVLNYDAETNTFSTDQMLALNGSKRALDYYLLYTDVNITKLIEVAATPADPEILDFVGTGTYPKVKFDIPAVDTEGNDLITAKLFYTIWVEKNGQEEKLTITAEEYRDVTEDMVEIPYNYDDNWDIYAGGATVYLNQSSDEIQSWTKIGVQSIYTAAGETNKSNVVWMDLTQYWETTGIAEVKNDGKKAVIFNMQGQKLNSVPAKGLYIMNNRKYVVK